MSQASVRTALLNTIEGIKNNPAMSGVVFRADTAWEEDVRCSAKIRDFAPFTIDEPLELGGQDSAANPVELVLVAWAPARRSCTPLMPRSWRFRWKRYLLRSVATWT